LKKLCRKPKSIRIVLFSNMRTLFATFALLILATVLAHCNEKKVTKLSKKYGRCIKKGYESTIDGCAEAFGKRNRKKKKNKLTKKKQKRCARIEKRLKKCGYSCVDSTESPTNSPTVRPTSTPTNSPTVRPTSTPTCTTCASGQFQVSSCTRLRDTVCRSCKKCAAGLISFPCKGTINTICASSFIYGLGKDRAVYRQLAVRTGRWRKITPGSVSQIQVVGKKLYGLGMDRAVYLWNNKWTKITRGPIRKFVVVPPGNIYALGMDNAIWRAVSLNKWTRVTSGWVSDFTISENRNFLGVGKNKAVYRHAMGGKGRWLQYTTTGVTQVEQVNKRLYGLGTNKAVYRWNKGKWNRITKAGSITKFDVSGRGVFGLGLKGAVLRASSLTNWTRFTNQSMIDFDVTYRRVD